MKVGLGINGVKLLAACYAATLAACATPQLACRGKVAAVLPMQPGFTVDATINGHSTRLLLDTGSSENILTTQATRRLALHTDRLVDDIDVPRGYALEGVGGRRHYDRVEVAKFGVGGLTAEGVPFAALWAGYGNWNVDGVLGMRTLGDYNIDVDATANRVTLYEPGAPCTEQAMRYSRVLLARNGAIGPLVEARLDGTWMLAVLDTGAERSILYAPLMPPGAGVSKLTADGIGPERERARLRPPGELRIGDLRLHAMEVIEVRQKRPGRADLVLGMDFFRRVHVLLAPASGTAWLRGGAGSSGLPDTDPGSGRMSISHYTPPHDVVDRG